MCRVCPLCVVPTPCSRDVSEDEMNEVLAVLARQNHMPVTPHVSIVATSRYDGE